MAKYCKQILGDMLVVPALRADGSLPSPDELKKKVVIKAKKVRICEDEASEDRSDELEDRNMQRGAKRRCIRDIPARHSTPRFPLPLPLCSLEHLF